MPFTVILYIEAYTFLADSIYIDCTSWSKYCTYCYI